MRDRTRKIILFLFIFIGLSVLNYPFVSQFINMCLDGEVILAYDDVMENLMADERAAMRAEAEAYNKELAGSSGAGIKDPFAVSEQQDERYEKLLNADGSGIMGYLSIPSIHVELPIYHGTSVRVLESGAGHLEGSSLPIGGESTHAVISAHNGLPSKLLFTDLDQLEKGDRFLLSVLGETFAYEVDKITTVKPEETDELQIVNGKDYVTLLTCTPYGVNSHRYLVRGHRISWDGEEVETSEAEGGKWNMGRIVFAVSLATLLLSMVILFLPIRKNNSPSRRDGSDKKEERRT